MESLSVKGKFLNIQTNVKNIKVIRAEKKRKYLLEFENPADNGKTLLAVKKFDQLAEFLGIGVNKLKSLIANEQVFVINQLFQNQPEDKTIQINAAEWEGAYWISLFATEKFEVITFTQIRKLIHNHFPDIEEKTFNRSIVWEKKISTIENNQDKFDTMLRITSGRNTKASAIKVIPYLRVHSCNNSVKCLDFSAIKHVSGWEDRLKSNIVESVKLLNSVNEALERGVEAISIEAAKIYIENLKLPVVSPAKIAHVKTLLLKRLEYEYAKNPNKFGLSQTLSYVGTHDSPENSTDHTLDILQLEAFNVLTAEVN